MIVLDTTVLVYAKGADHPLRGPSRELIAAIADGGIQATTSIEVVQEFVHVRARRRGREDAAELGRSYADLLSPLLAVTEEHLAQGLALYARVERLGAFDAVLAAAAAASGAEALVSADVAFTDVPRLRHALPDRAGVDALLGLGSS